MERQLRAVARSRRRSEIRDAGRRREVRSRSGRRRGVLAAQTEKRCLGHRQTCGRGVVLTTSPFAALLRTVSTPLKPRGNKHKRRTRSSRCSAESAKRTEIRLPVSFHPRTMRPCRRSIISSQAIRESRLERCYQTNVGRSTRRKTYRTKAMILGGWLRRVWKKRLLLIT
jgi:hypothetical protein